MIASVPIRLPDVSWYVSAGSASPYTFVFASAVMRIGRGVIDRFAPVYDSA